MAEDWAAVARAIRARMEEQGISQQDLAARSGVSPATLREMQKVNEPKQRRRSPRTLSAVSKALGWNDGHLAAVLNGSDLSSAAVGPESAGLASVILAHLEEIHGELRMVSRKLDQLSSGP